MDTTVDIMVGTSVNSVPDMAHVKRSGTANVMMVGTLVDAAVNTAIDDAIDETVDMVVERVIDDMIDDVIDDMIDDIIDSEIDMLVDVATGTLVDTMIKSSVKQPIHLMRKPTKQSKKFTANHSHLAKKEKDMAASRTRRQRGYQWEETISKRFNSTHGWKAFPLGSPSTGLPDALAVNTAGRAIYAIEAKSGTSMSLPVPADQIQRCMKWTQTFDLYKERKAILAFKFLSKKRLGVGKYEGRELREFFKVWGMKRPPVDCICTYEGKVFTRINGKKTELRLKEQEMPFKTRQPASTKRFK